MHDGFAILCLGFSYGPTLPLKFPRIHLAQSECHVSLGRTSGLRRSAAVCRLLFKTVTAAAGPE